MVKGWREREDSMLWNLRNLHLPPFAASLGDEEMESKGKPITVDHLSVLVTFIEALLPTPPRFGSAFFFSFSLSIILSYLID